MTVLASLLLLFPFAAQAAELGTRHTLTVGKMERVYHLYVPETKDDGDKRSLVVVLHDEGRGARGIAEATGFSELAKKRGFAVAYPEGSGHVPTWNAGRCCGYAERTQVDDVAFIAAMVREIQGKHAINPARVYATGFSNGGMMAYRLGCDLSGMFAAIAPVAGAMNVTGCDGKGRPSVLAFHALDDKHVRYDGGMPEEGARERIGRSLAPDASVGDAMRYWLKADYCRDFPGHETGDGYRKVTYFCAEDRHVVLYTLDQGGHVWPKKPLDATDEIWRFFRLHPPRELF